MYEKLPNNDSVWSTWIGCQDTSDPRHFGPKTLRHWCRSVRKTLRHWCRSVRTLRHWCRNVRKTLRYRSVFGVVCAIVCCDITIAILIGLAWSLRTRRNCFNAVYLKHDGAGIDWADRTASVRHSRSVAAVCHVNSANMPWIAWVFWLTCLNTFNKCKLTHLLMVLLCCSKSYTDNARTYSSLLQTHSAIKC